ncbi:MAG: hypothetical protein HYR66_01390 [Sphingobacteriales bacterium]|nr:hypothetical protein [Sphingobacteriales bacterium]MBI3718022.1 hypothetical protein [Sphingobacteriales bacterium]
MNRLIFVMVSLGLSFLINGSFNSDWYALVSYALLFYFLLDFVYAFGRDLRVLDLPILLSVFQCLVMPAIVYHLYNDDYYVKALKFDMSVNEDAYYGYMLPAVIALIIGLRFPLRGIQPVIGTPDFYRITVNGIKEHLKGKEKTGLLLIAIGFSFGIFEKFLPQTLAYFLFLFSKLIYVGIIYIYFSDSPRKNLYLAGGLFLALTQAILTGLFGDLVFLTALSILLVLLGKQVNFGKSIILILIGGFFVLILQTLKQEYRKLTWKDSSADKASVFFNIAMDRATNIESIFDKEGAFPVVVRFNEGMIVGKVMDYVPRITPYQDGKTIWLSLAASFVPRYLWPDKPEAGGHENMRLFTGYNIEGYSMNIGPYGEAYGNFGKNGGIFYMFVYGLFFNFVFYQIQKISKQRPTILLWVPYLFLNSIQVETDTLLTVNTIIKGALFIWLFFFVFERTTRLSL